MFHVFLLGFHSDHQLLGSTEIYVTNLSKLLKNHQGEHPPPEKNGEMKEINETKNVYNPGRDSL